MRRLVIAALVSSAAAAHAHIAALKTWMNAAGGPCDPAFEVCVDKFVDELPLPATAARRHDDDAAADGRVHTYKLDMAQCAVKLHSQLPPTTMFCYGAAVVGGARGEVHYSSPGPSIEATVGVPVRVGDGASANSRPRLSRESTAKGA